MIKSYNNTPSYGSIQIYNQGGFVVYFTITYTIGRIVHKVNSPLFLAAQNRQLIIPGNATNVSLDIYISVWVQVWKNIFHKDFNKLPFNCYRVYGYAFYALCEEIPCPNNYIVKNSDIPSLNSINCYSCCCKCKC